MLLSLLMHAGGKQCVTDVLLDWKWQDVQSKLYCAAIMLQAKGQADEHRWDISAFVFIPLCPVITTVWLAC